MKFEQTKVQLFDIVPEMVKLYYTATSCGASNFIAAFVAGISIDAETVSIYNIVIFLHFS